MFIKISTSHATMAVRFMHCFVVARVGELEKKQKSALNDVKRKYYYY